MTLLFCGLLSLSFGLTSKVPKVLVPLKCTCIPLDLHICFKPFPYILDVGYYNGDVPVIVVAAVAVCTGRVPIGIGVLVVVVFPSEVLLKMI